VCCVRFGLDSERGIGFRIPIKDTLIIPFVFRRSFRLRRIINSFPLQGIRRIKREVVFMALEKSLENHRMSHFHLLSFAHEDDFWEFFWTELSYGGLRINNLTELISASQLFPSKTLTVRGAIFGVTGCKSLNDDKINE